MAIFIVVSESGATIGHYSTYEKAAARKRNYDGAGGSARIVVKTVD